MIRSNTIICFVPLVCGVDPGGFGKIGSFPVIVFFMYCKRRCMQGTQIPPKNSCTTGSIVLLTEAVTVAGENVVLGHLVVTKTAQLVTGLLEL